MEKRKRLPLKIRIFNTIVHRREQGKLPPRECRYRICVRHEADCASHDLLECACRAKVWLIYRRRPYSGVRLSERSPHRNYWHWLADIQGTARKMGSSFLIRCVGLKMGPKEGENSCARVYLMHYTG